MRKITLVFFYFLFFDYSDKAQKNNVESNFLGEIFHYYEKINIDTPRKIIVNSSVSRSPKFSYSMLTTFWHLNKMLPEDCYSSSDSVLNLKILKDSFSLQSNNPNISFIQASTFQTSAEHKVYIYKRFYYCNKIFILGVSKPPWDIRKDQFLGIYNLEGKLLDFKAISYIE